ncbi:excinuclease ATPase subunit [Parachitinimonas caeni]|uniref:Excinuclease ATPase subunit n=1 Tax=Parachitinimonas caeni TaxID=3031301 RepID=A0ABT7DXZ1_9NEIS|nr:excinuclease ATPase subunit [Parachitinimonas caeni]MDK2124910.1 excinuclease ATPase subunit [Parachitinimonas caeni]
MKKLLVLSLISLGLSAPALARDTVLDIPLEDVLSMPEAKDQLDGSVKFFLSGAKTPKIIKKFGSDTSNKKTNGVGKSDEFGCKWAALSALAAFQQSAKREGANAVIDMVSYYRKEETKDPKTFRCHAGSFVVGVTLKGTYAKIAD